MLTKPRAQVTPADLRGAIFVAVDASNIVTIYYVGDPVPRKPEPTPAQLAALAAAEAKDLADAHAARTYAKLQALRDMSPAEIQTWMSANVTTLAQARDALTTLAVAVSVLARHL